MSRSAGACSTSPALVVSFEEALDQVGSASQGLELIGVQVAHAPRQVSVLAGASALEHRSALAGDLQAGHPAVARVRFTGDEVALAEPAEHARGRGPLDPLDRR